MIEIVNKKDANCITHYGKMHADDVFSTAFLELYLGNIKLFRTNEVTKEDFKEGVYIYDIGLGEFDHHQPNAKIRENGIMYCSFGLLWEKFGKDYLKNQNIEDIDAVYNAFIKDFVEAIDADDNGMFPKIEANYKVKTLSMVIDIFNVSYDSGDDSNKQFLKAEKFAKELIVEELKTVIGKQKAYKKVEKIIKNNTTNILVLDEFLPYNDALQQLDTDKKISFVIYPSDRGGYAIKGVAKSTDDKALRVPFPKEWAGLTNKELEDISGVVGATFCHNKCFIASALTLSAAKEMASIAIKCQVKEKINDNID